MQFDGLYCICSNFRVSVEQVSAMYRELQYQSVYGLAEELQISIISNGHAPHGPAHWPSSVMAHYENLKINIRVYTGGKTENIHVAVCPWIPGYRLLVGRCNKLQ